MIVPVDGLRCLDLEASLYESEGYDDIKSALDRESEPLLRPSLSLSFAIANSSDSFFELSLSFSNSPFNV